MGGIRSCLRWKIEARPRFPPVNLRGNVEPHPDGICGAKLGVSERRLLMSLRGANFFLGTKRGGPRENWVGGGLGAIAINGAGESDEREPVQFAGGA